MAQLVLFTDSVTGQTKEVSTATPLPVTGGGGGFQFASGAAFVPGDFGTQALVVRNDVGGALVANGAYTPLTTDSNGSLYVHVTATGGTATLTPSSGQVVVAVGPTATPLAGVATQVDEVVIVTNLTNVGTIYLGDSTVTTLSGLKMEPGRSVTLENVDLNTVYIQGTAGEGVSFFSLT